MPTRTKVIPKSTSKPTHITPSMAMDWLDTMVTNRRLSQGLIDAIARDISNGKWRINGDPIRFDTKGHLIDGQHRLWAIIEANKPVDSYVVTDIHPSAMSTIDTGKRRSFSNHLEITGHPLYATCVAAMVRLLWVESIGSEALDSGHLVPTHQELMALHRNNPNLLASAEATMMSPFLVSHSIIAFAHFKMAKLNRKTADQWAHFLTSGEGFTKNHPVLHLRNRFIAVRNSNTQRLRRVEILALCYKSWNYMRNGKTCLSLRWLDSEPLPTLK